MEKRTNKKFLTGSILLLAAVLFLLVNLCSSIFLKAVNIDLTGNKLYTLSAGTKEIIGELSEPVILKFYFSKKLSRTNPYLMSFAARVQDLLVEYQRAAKGKIIVEIIDPEPFSRAEDDALNLGLQGLPFDNTGMELYLGLVGFNSVNTRVIIPFMQPNREISLEYDISQLLYKLVHPQPKVIGVMSALPLQGRDSRPWAIWQQMNQTFQVKSIDIDAKAIPENISTLMIVDPEYFSTSALKAIDKFVLRGGNLIAFVDPFTETMDAESNKINNLNKDGGDFNQLLHAWGVQLNDKVVADRAAAKSVRIQTKNGEMNVRYPVWVDFTNKNFDKNDVLTASMERITMASPGALSKASDAESTFTPLITSSKDSSLISKRDIPELQKNYNEFMKSYQPTGSYVVAARISGPVKSAYGEESVLKSNIIVVADADILHDHFWLNISNVMGQQVGVPTAANGNFVISALENLSGSNSLISIRNRGGFTRPFETIKSLEEKSQNKYRESEQQLQQKLEKTKQSLAELMQQNKDGKNAQLGAEQIVQQQRAFRQELLNTRRELRDVRRKINSDIESLQEKIKFFSIWFMPTVIVLAWLAVMGFRRSRWSTPKH